MLNIKRVCLFDYLLVQGILPTLDKLFREVPTCISTEYEILKLWKSPVFQLCAILAVTSTLIC